MAYRRYRTRRNTYKPPAPTPTARKGSAALEVHYGTTSILDRMKQVPEGNHSRDEGSTNGTFRTTSFNTTVQRVQDGWNGVTDKVQDFGDKLAHLMTNARPGLNALTYGEDGDWVDIGKYLDGDMDECFVSLTEGAPVPTRSLNMIVNITASWSVHASALEMRGAAIAYLIDYFRRCGVNISLWAAFYTAGLPTKDGADIDTLHLYNIDTTEGYSLNQLASYIALPDFMRRISFAVCELQAKLPNCSGYGNVREFITNGEPVETLTEEAIETLGGREAISKALYFGAGSNSWDSFDYTVNEICNIIDTFNGAKKEEAA